MENIALESDGASIVAIAKHFCFRTFDKIDIKEISGSLKSFFDII